LGVGDPPSVEVRKCCGPSTAISRYDVWRRAGSMRRQIRWCRFGRKTALDRETTSAAIHQPGAAGRRGGARGSAVRARSVSEDPGRISLTFGLGRPKSAPSTHTLDPVAGNGHSTRSARRAGWRPVIPRTPQVHEPADRTPERHSDCHPTLVAAVRSLPRPATPQHARLGSPSRASGRRRPGIGFERSCQHEASSLYARGLGVDAHRSVSRRRKGGL